MKKNLFLLIIILILSGCAIYPTYQTPPSPVAYLSFQPVKGVYNPSVVIYKNSDYCRGPQQLPNKAWQNNAPIAITANQEVAFEISWDKGLEKICDMMASFTPLPGHHYIVLWGTDKRTCFLEMQENINNNIKPLAFDRRLRAAMIFSTIQSYCRPLQANSTYELYE